MSSRRTSLGVARGAETAVGACRLRKRRGLPVERAIVQMRTEDYVEGHIGQLLDGKQQVTVGQMLAGFPMPPCGGGNPERTGGAGNAQVPAAAPLPEPQAECDPGGVMMMTFSGVHRGEAL